MDDKGVQIYITRLAVDYNIAIQGRGRAEEALQDNQNKLNSARGELAAQEEQNRLHRLWMRSNLTFHQQAMDTTDHLRRELEKAKTIYSDTSGLIKAAKSRAETIQAASRTASRFLEIREALRRGQQEAAPQYRGRAPRGGWQ